MNLSGNDRFKGKYDELAAQISVLSNAAFYGRSEKEQRFRKSYLYFHCLEPKKHGNELSTYVEPVVRRAVEAIKPSLMMVFTENEKRAVQFRPLTRSNLNLDVVATGAGYQIANLIDEYINKVFIQENEGFDLLDRSITEALVTGDVFLKYFVEEEKNERDFVFDKTPAEALDAILTDYPDTDTEKMMRTVSKRKGLLTGKFTALRIEKKIRIEFVPFNDVFITGQYEDIRDARYMCHRILTTVGAMVERGYDAEVLSQGANNYIPRNQYGPLSTQTLVNLEVFGEDLGTYIQSMDPMEKNVYVYEHYVYSSVVDKRSNKSKLYRVLSTETTILEVEETSCIPFVHGVPERIPGSFWGTSMYDKFGPIQDMLSRMMRAAEYNTCDQAYGRYLAIEGMYNRASLLNNRPGSVIEVNQQAGPQAVQRFDKEALPQAFESFMAKITENYQNDIRSTVGIDVSGSNVSATAAAITAHSADMKDKVIARTLAYTLFKPLFEGIYNIIVAEDILIGEIPNPQVQEAAAAGLSPEQMQQVPQTLPIRGADLPQVGDFIIDVNTQNDEAMLNAQIINLMTMFAQVQPGTINPTEVAAQLTGLPVEEVERFFPPAPQPTEEDMMIEQATKQMALEQGALNLELLKGQMSKLAAEIFEIEAMVEMKTEDAEAKRLREEEESLQKFKVIELKEKELTYELETGNKVQVSEYTR